MRDKFFEFRPAATDPGELPPEDRHRLGDPNSCALESLAQPAQSRHAAARRPWSMHTQDERCCPVEPDIQVELAADVLPRPGRRDLIEQRGDSGVIGAGPGPEPPGHWWTLCQSWILHRASLEACLPPVETACPCVSLDVCAPGSGSASTMTRTRPGVHVDRRSSHDVDRPHPQLLDLS